MVVERRNKMLMDMVRCMISYSNLPLGLWMEVLKTAMHKLNRVPSKSVDKTPYELWTNKKPTLNYFHIWGCPAEARIFEPRQGKLDERTTSYHFIGYPERSKGYRFYSLDRQTKFIETKHAIFLEDDMIKGSKVLREVDLQEKRTYVPIPMVEEPYFSIPAIVPPTVVMTGGETPATNVASPSATTKEQVASPFAPPSSSEPVAQESSHDSGSAVPSDAPLLESQNEPELETSLRRSQRSRRSMIPNDYGVYTGVDIESDEIYMSGDIDVEDDPTTYEIAMTSANSSKWLPTMEDELESMRMNNVWDLEVIPQGAKTVGYKWVYKTKRDSRGDVERYKARLVAKGFTQREGIVICTRLYSILGCPIFTIVG
jgi:hypothetical protein